jgi:hypothetical protein
MHVAGCAGLLIARLSRDVQGYSKSSSVLEPLNVYKGHTAIVEVGPNEVIDVLDVGLMVFAPRTLPGMRRTRMSLPRSAMTGCSCCKILRTCVPVIFLEV